VHTLIPWIRTVPARHGRAELIISVDENGNANHDSTSTGGMYGTRTFSYDHHCHTGSSTPSVIVKPRPNTTIRTSHSGSCVCDSLVFTMMRFDVLTFQVPDIAAAKAFYMDILGMHAIDDSIGYANDGLKLRFAKCDTQRKATSRDAYWKIGITIKNLDHAVAFLKENNVSCSAEPSQFLDIGYLCHLRDPSGLGIELLQQGFEGKHVETQLLGGHAIGGQATLAHISIRVSDLEKAKLWCEETHGMRLMSIQPVDLFGFTLYFYTWSDEEIPGDLRSKDIREWLWARPYAMLELQHIGGSSFLRKLPPGSAGPTKIVCCNGEREIEIDCSKDLEL